MAAEADDSTNEVARPKAKVVVQRDYCTRFAGEACNRCERACPHQAISFEENMPVVETDSCNGCGICFGICDAFASTRITMNDLVARVRRIALTGKRVYLTCRENVFEGFTPDHHVIVLPCLSMCPPEFWAQVLAEGIRVSIAGDLNYCDDCERAGSVGATLYPRAIEIAQEWTGCVVGYSTEIPESRTLKEKYTSDDALGRRAAFTNLADDFGSIVSGKRRLQQSEVLHDFHERRERMRASSRLSFDPDSPINALVNADGGHRTLFPRRQMLLYALEAEPAIAERIDLVVSGTDEEACTGCGECVRACPTGARSVSKGTLPETDLRYCIGCDICTQACPENACYLYETDACGLAPKQPTEEE